MNASSSNWDSLAVRERSQVKVAVVGGGIIGTCIAAELAFLGASVTLFEAGPRLGCGATSAAIGGISPLSDDFIRARLAPISADIFEAFWRLIRRCDDSGCKVDLVDAGMLFLALTESESSWLRGIYSAELPKQFKSRWLTPQEVAELEPSLGDVLQGALLLLDEPALDPLAFMKCLETLLEKSQNVFVKLDTTVTAVSSDQLVTFKISDTTATTMEFDYIIISTGNATSLLPDFLKGTIVSVKGQALQFRDPLVSTPPIDHHIYAHWSGSRFPNLNTSLYLVPRPDGSIVTGVTYEKVYVHREVTASAISDIVSGLLSLVPKSENWTLVRSWAGERPASVDGGPIIGVHPAQPRVIYALGHYGLGVTLAPLTAELVAEYLGLAARNLLTKSAYSHVAPTRFVIPNAVGEL